MKSIKKNKTFLTRRKLAFIVLVILIALGCVAAAYATKTWPFEETATYEKSSDNTVDTKKEGNDTTDSEETTANTPAQSPPTSAPEDKTNQTGNAVSSVGAPEAPNVTRAEQSGSSIRVSAIFNNASNGRCVMRLEKSGYASIVKDASIIVGPSYYVCNGFQVPRSELPTSGEWSVIVIHELNGKSSPSERKSFNVQ